jgi:hypothetical protein
MGELLPPSYISLEVQIARTGKEKRPVITWKELMKLAHRAHLHESLLESAVQFLQDVGVIFRSTAHEDLLDFVVLSPQWLSKALACIVTAQGHDNKEAGIISKDDMHKIWQGYLCYSVLIAKMLLQLTLKIFKLC